MTKDTGFFMDFSKFEKDFKRLVEKKIPSSASEGEVNAANEILRDSVEIPPQAPKDIGDLWGSRIVEGVKNLKELIKIIFGFNIKYAHRHHEAEPGAYNYTLTKGATQPGPKFMQSKMVRFKKKYIEIIVNSMKRIRR